MCYKTTPYGVDRRFESETGYALGYLYTRILCFWTYCQLGPSHYLDSVHAVGRVAADDASRLAEDALRSGLPAVFGLTACPGCPYAVAVCRRGMHVCARARVPAIRHIAARDDSTDTETHRHRDSTASQP